MRTGMSEVVLGSALHGEEAASQSRDRRLHHAEIVLECLVCGLRSHAQLS